MNIQNEIRLFLAYSIVIGADAAIVLGLSDSLWGFLVVFLFFGGFYLYFIWTNGGNLMGKIITTSAGGAIGSSVPLYKLEARVSDCDIKATKSKPKDITKKITPIKDIETAMVNWDNILVNGASNLGLEELKFLIVVSAHLNTRIGKERQIGDLNEEEIQEHLSVWFRTSDLLDFMGLGKENVSYFEKFLYKLFDKSVAVRDVSEQTFEGLHWIDYFKVWRRRDQVNGIGATYIRLGTQIAPYLLGLVSGFTPLEIKYITLLRKMYALRLYMLLKQFKSTGWRLISLSDFQWQLSISTKYPGWQAVKKDVLAPSLKEINERTDIKDAEYIGIREGQKIEEINGKIYIDGVDFETAKNQNITGKVLAILFVFSKSPSLLAKETQVSQGSLDSLIQEALISESLIPESLVSEKERHEMEILSIIDEITKKCGKSHLGHIKKIAETIPHNIIRYLLKNVREVAKEKSLRPAQVFFQRVNDYISDEELKQQNAILDQKNVEERRKATEERRRNAASDVARQTEEKNLEKEFKSLPEAEQNKWFDNAVEETPSLAKDDNSSIGKLWSAILLYLASLKDEGKERYPIMSKNG